MVSCEIKFHNCEDIHCIYEGWAVYYIHNSAQRGLDMDISYNKLFKILIDRKMKKKDLQEAAGLSPASIAKLSKDQYVSMEVLVKVCRALDVNIGDIIEIIPTGANNAG